MGCVRQSHALSVIESVSAASDLDLKSFINKASKSHMLRDLRLLPESAGPGMLFLKEKVSPMPPPRH